MQGISKGMARLLSETGEEEVIHVDSLQRPNQMEGSGYSDMVDIVQLNEVALLQNTRLRFLQDDIYTYVGPTLLAVNPFRRIESLVSSDCLLSY